MVDYAFIGNLGTTELVIILVIVLILFGAGKLPQVGSAIGKAIGNFKRAVQDKNDNHNNDASKPLSSDKSSDSS